MDKVYLVFGQKGFFYSFRLNGVVGSGRDECADEVCLWREKETAKLGLRHMVMGLLYTITNCGLVKTFVNEQS